MCSKKVLYPNKFIRDLPYRTFQVFLYFFECVSYLVYAVRHILEPLLLKQSDQLFSAILEPAKTRMTFDPRSPPKSTSPIFAVLAVPMWGFVCRFKSVKHYK